MTTTDWVDDDIVIVLHKGANDFLYVFPSTTDTVDYIELYLSGPPETPAAGCAPVSGEVLTARHEVKRLSRDELEFFDATGRVLEVIESADYRWRLEPVEPAIHQQALRERIRLVYDAANEMARRRADAEHYEADPVFHTLQQLELPAPELPFPTFISQVMKDPLVQFDSCMNCSWVAHVFWGC